MDLFLRDIQHAIRGLWRAPAFTVVAVLTLALGIAGTAVMFALVNGVLVRPLPVREQDRLIVAWKEIHTSGSARYPFGNTEIEAVAEHSRLLERAAGVARNGVRREVVTENGVPSYANVALVTGGFFDVLGVQAALGRTLTIADEKSGAERAVVVSNAFWRRRHGSDGSLPGSPLLIGEQPFRVVGVMPPDLDYPADVDIWRTTSSAPMTGPFGDAAQREVNLVARLRPGVTFEQAAAEIAALTRVLDADAPDSTLRGLVPIVRPFADEVVGDVRAAMFALLCAVGLVLLIASGNVANLLLLRGDARRGEFALRSALGAARGRIVRHIFAESVVVAALAGSVGLLATWWTLDALVTLVPDGLPRVESIRVDGMVIVFSVGLTFLAAFLAGLAPSLYAVRSGLVAQLGTASHGIARTPASRGRRILAAAQVALAVAVVAAAGLLVRSVLKLQSIDLGMPAERLVLLDLHVPSATYTNRPEYAQFLDATIAQLEALPAVSAATPVNVPPFSAQGWDVPRFVAEGQNADEAAANPSLNLESIHPNYFGTFEVPIVQGRAFSEADRWGVLAVAIVSQDVARRMWPGENPVGRRLKMGRLDSSDPWYTIVGVAGSTRYREVTSARPTLYLPAAQFQMTASMIVVRTTAAPDVILPAARDRIRAIDRNIQIVRAAPFAEMLDRPLARARFNALLLVVFGLSAALLSTIGLYGIMAAAVRQRYRELGVRLALGASAAEVRGLILTEGLQVAAAGAAFGMAGALMTGRALRSLLFETDPLDPGAMAAGTVLVIAAAAVACYIPAVKASRVEPSIALRHD